MSWDGYGGKSLEEWQEIWRQERLREDEMLVFYDHHDSPITGKALAEIFNLTPARVNLLIRRRREARERERMANELEQLKADTFTAMAERLWMDLGWLVMALENTKGTIGPMVGDRLKGQ